MAGRHAQPHRRGFHRIPSYASLLPEIRQSIDELAEAYGVSPSWVIAVGMAEHLGIRVPAVADYRREPWNRPNGRRNV